MAERLTKRVSSYKGKGIYIAHCTFDEQLQALARYEDLVEQGTLIELPCVPNENVWIIHERFGVIKTSFACYSDILYNMENGYQFAKTKEEAEEKLKELRGEQE